MWTSADDFVLSTITTNMSEPATSMAAGRAAAPIVADAAGAAAAAAPMRADLAQLKDDRKLLKQTLKQVSKSIKNEDPGCTATLDFRFQLRWMDAFIPFWNSLPSSIKRHSSEIYNYAIILGGRCTQTLRSRYVYNSIVRISFLHVYVYIQYLVTIYIYIYICILIYPGRAAIVSLHLCARSFEETNQHKISAGPCTA